MSDQPPTRRPTWRERRRERAERRASERAAARADAPEGPHIDAEGHLHDTPPRIIEAHPGPHIATPPVRPGCPEGHGAGEADALSVMTLNVAHGRGARLHQTFLRRRTIETHLTAIASLLGREAPDLVALQEADGPCLWSGGFDHVDWLAREGGFGWHVRGSHVQGRRLDYGTALLSRLRPADPLAITFRPSPPTPTKGFVVATVEHGGHTIDVVSVHLDFSRSRVRRRQVAELAEALQARDHLRVVMGDLNCDWRERGGTLRTLSEALEVEPHAPHAHEGFGTYRGRARLDWVLTSPTLTVQDYRVLPDVVSDHRAVIARLGLPNG